MSQVRLGVIGCGNMAQNHMRYFEQLNGVTYTAASDLVEQNLKTVVETYNVKGFGDGEELIRSGLVDAIMIATPHYFHPHYAKLAIENGIHVMTEKPVSVTAKTAGEVNDTLAKYPGAIYSVMHQMRTSGRWVKVKELIDSGVLGDIQRVHWTATDWFRTQTYYDSGGWRATWKGEGGGVLLNQCPHNIDLLYWLFGSPTRITASVSLGKYHQIEVEDDVSAIMEYKNGATGVFIASTGEYPGSNYMEVVGDRGRLVLEKSGPLRLTRLEGSVRKFCATSESRMGQGPGSEEQLIETDAAMFGSHAEVMQNFIDAIIANDPSKLIAPGVEGLYSVEMINAMIMSGITRKPIDLPMDRDAYEAMLADLIEKSTSKV